MNAVLERTSKDDQRIARSSVIKIKEASGKPLPNDKGVVKIKIQESGLFLTIPKKALSLLFEILNNMALGKSITLIPSDTEISTQQAADMLNVSRPHLVKLLEEGLIPFKKVGSHRRVKLKHLIDYEKALNENRNKNLAFLAKQAQNLNMGY